MGAITNHGLEPSMRASRLIPFLACLVLAPVLALAHGYAAGPLKIGHPWSRATPPAAQVAGGYLTITNTGATDDRLVAITSDASERVEIHEMKMEGGVMRMRQLGDGLPLPAGKQTTLAPGGYHLMFIKPKQPFKAGDRITASLQFQKAGKVVVEFAVVEAGAMPKPAELKPADAKPAGHESHADH